MYLTIRQHDAFRNLLMGFEIPFRAYIAEKITGVYKTDVDFETAMKTKYSLLTTLRNIEIISGNQENML